MNYMTCFLGRFMIVSVAVLGMASSILAAESKTTTERIAKIKVVKTIAGEKTEIATQIVFQPGKRAEMKIGGTKSGDTTNTIEIVVNPRLNEKPIQHLIEFKIIEQIGNEEPSILAAPIILTQEGQQASIQIGEKNGDGISIDLIVEPVK